MVSMINVLSLNERQKLEAVERMKLLKLHPNAIREFVEENKLNKSEGRGILFWLEDSELEFVKQFEQEHDAVVYHLIKSYTSIGTMLTAFFVSRHMEEWELDRADMEDDIQLCYVKNLDYDWCSEFGSVGFRRINGGLMRVA